MRLAEMILFSLGRSFLDFDRRRHSDHDHAHNPLEAGVGAFCWYPLVVRPATLLLMLVLAFPASAQDGKKIKPIKIGKPAPDFTLLNQLGKKIRLAAFKKKTKKRGPRWVLIAFYPKAGTSG